MKLNLDAAPWRQQTRNGLGRWKRTLGGTLAWLFGKPRIASAVNLAAVVCALALATLSAAEPARSSSEAAGASLGERGEVDRIEFEGGATFDRDAVRNALAQNPGFLLAAHPQAPLAAFLETLQQKVLAGYQQNGFPNAEVSAALDSVTGRIRVRVTEGARYRCGDVRVTGAKPAAAAAIIARLRQAVLLPSKTSEMTESMGKNPSGGDDANGENRVHVETRLNLERREPRNALAARRHVADIGPLWAPGQPAACGEAAAKQIEEVVKDCLAEYGLFFPKTGSSVQLNPENSTADLLVQVRDEGPHGVVSELEVTGNHKHTREEILEFLGLRVGMEISRSGVVAAEQKLARSARFLDYGITPTPAVAGLTQATSVRLAVKVREYDAAPKLNEPLTGEQQALLRLCDWLSDFATRPADLSIAGALTVQNDAFRLAADIIVSRQGALIKLKAPTIGQGLDYAVLFARETLGVYAAERGYKFFVNQPDLASEATIQLTADGAQLEHPFNFAVSAGCRRLADTEKKLGTIPAFRLELKLAPVAFLHLLEATNLDVRLANHRLSLVSSNYVLRLDAGTGQLEELIIRDPQVEVRFVEGAFDQAWRELEVAAAGLANRYDSNHPLSSLVSFGALELGRWRGFDPMATNLPSAQRLRAIAAVDKLLSTTVLAPIDQALSSTNQAEPFTVPADEMDRALAQNSISAFFAAVAFRYCSEFFPKHSWPWTIARESVFVLAHQPTYTDSELARLYESADTGPVGCAVIAWLLDKMNSPSAKTFAVQGLLRLGVRDFRKDCHLFLQGESRLARAFANATVVLRELPPEDIAALAALLPTDEAGFLKDSVRALRAAPTDPPAASLGPALEQYWVKSLRARVRAVLLRLSVTAPPPPAPRI